jgi:hypothetical protein
VVYEVTFVDLFSDDPLLSARITDAPEPPSSHDYFSRRS